jgi:hypothetical protein
MKRREVKTESREEKKKEDQRRERQKSRETLCFSKVWGVEK